MRAPSAILLLGLACTTESKLDSGDSTRPDSPGDSHVDSLPDSSTDSPVDTGPGPADWAPGDRVLLVYDPGVDGSFLVAQAYADFRDVPDTNLCGVEATSTTSIDSSEFVSWVAQVQSCLDAAGDHLQYIVTVYGVPYRVSGMSRTSPARVRTPPSAWTPCCSWGVSRPTSTTPSTIPPGARVTRWLEATTPTSHGTNYCRTSKPRSACPLGW